MRTVWKYQPFLDAIVEIETKAGARLLKIAADPSPLSNSRPIAFWFEVDTDAPAATQTFYVVGTGREVPDGVEYVDSVITPPFVWHIYKDTPNDPSDRHNSRF